MKIPTIILAFCLFSCSAAYSADWPHWRGPHFNGSTDETPLPTDWSTTDHVRWSAELPGPSAATPVVWKDRVLVSSTDPKNDQLVAICFNRLDGTLLWQRSIATGIRRDSRSTFAAPSPVTDGNRAVFFYSNGTLVSYDMSGKLQWNLNIQKQYGPFAFGWTFSSSPLLFADKLYVQVLQRDVPVQGRGWADRKNESYLLALDPRTGKKLWQHVRPSNAVAESREAFSSPIPYEYDGRSEVLLIGGDAISGHDPETGKEFWRWGTWNPTRITHWRLVPSPIAGDGVILACAPTRSPIYAVKAGGQGSLKDDALAWVSKEQRAVTSDVPTPAFYDGDFFVLSKKRRCLSRVVPKTGQVKWTIQTPGRRDYEASPLAADGKIYLVNFDGLVVIVSAKTGKILREIPMGQRAESPVRSSIVAAHGNLFIRTNTKLYCIGK